jgi:putative ABC transport system permease protein
LRPRLLQFLVEAVVLSGMGGLLGIAVGFGAAGIMAHFMGCPMVVTTSWVALAVGISSGIGVVIGFYPARRRPGSTPSNPGATSEAQRPLDC